MAILLMLVLASTIGLAYGMGVEATDFFVFNVGPGPWQRIEMGRTIRSRVEIATFVCSGVLFISLVWFTVRCGELFHQCRRLRRYAWAVLLLVAALIVTSGVGGYRQGYALGKTLWPN